MSEADVLWPAEAGVPYTDHVILLHFKSTRRATTATLPCPGGRMLTLVHRLACSI